MLNAPDTAPLIAATWIGSPPETCCVKLLATAQQRRGRGVGRAPPGSPAPAPGARGGAAPPPTIGITPTRPGGSKFSGKTNHAITAVKTPSRFRSSDAVDACVA